MANHVESRLNTPAQLERDLAGLAWGLARVRRLLAMQESELMQPTPGISEWCIGKQLNHVILANDLLVRNAATVIKGKGMLLREPTNRDPEGLAILERGRFPRGQAEAPRFVRPPKDVDVRLCLQLLGEVEDELRHVADNRQALLSETRVVPHQSLGDLTGPEWIRFAHGHTVHHLLIVRDQLAARGNEALS